MCVRRELEKELDSGTQQAEVHNGQKSTTGRSPQRAEVHNRQKFKTGKSHTADRGKQQAEVQNRTEVHNSQKFKTGKNHKADKRPQQVEVTQQTDVHNRQKFFKDRQKLHRVRSKAGTSHCSKQKSTADRSSKQAKVTQQVMP
ncbi:hypothetical protein AVEN_25795-1 [Araneus ventricosus]|uniref:Uncharacterized protein n=1 Tax=Araneus ventricosus TaxID=182803 RepID=A0A4Y2R5U7_ARAVE|nr:hypothetical protein AVEN_25795-1 [Araneus ventricosus]